MKKLLGYVCILALAGACSAAEGGVSGPAGGSTGKADSAGSIPWLEALEIRPHQENHALLARLSLTGASLVERVVQAEASDGFAISAKFELNHAGDALDASVYNARRGKDVAPEANELVELAGNTENREWAPHAEVFEDFRHIARASMHLTLMQLGGWSLTDVIDAASEYGEVYRVEPAVFDGQAVFHCLLRDSEGEAIRIEFAPRVYQAATSDDASDVSDNGDGQDFGGGV